MSHDHAVDYDAPRQPCPHSSPDDECRACRIKRRAAWHSSGACECCPIPPADGGTDE